jgi:hypothetical protein
MKKLLFIFSFALITFIAKAGEKWIQISSPSGKPQIVLESSNVNNSVININIEGFWKRDVETSKGSAWLINLGNNIRNLEKGTPDLPYLSTSLIIPDMAKMSFDIISSDYKDFDNVLIAPSKGNLFRNIDPSTVSYEYGKVYQENDFYPGELAKLNRPYIVRDFRGQSVWIMPLQYNPVTKVLRVYYNIKIKISAVGSAVVNPLVRNKPLSKVDMQFEQLYKRHFLNYQAAGQRYNPVGEHGNMLIISYGDFMDEMEPLIAWKKSSGIPVEIVDVADIGNNASSIKQYVTDYYNDKGLTFLLLVGDAAQVTPSYSGGDSDNDYTYVVGDDHYPDLFCGRFSAETEEQVVTQVTKVLNYEKMPNMEDTDWYSHAVGIASDQGPGDDDEMDYEHIRNIQNNKLIPYTYTYAYELFDGSQGGEDQPGYPTPSDVAADINEGATIINYTGHGGVTSWVTSGFSNNDVNSLTNAGKLPFIFSVSCVNGNFVGNTCFAEAWLRAVDNDGNPVGAVSVIMSTINQSWNPPMRGQDAMNDILVETYPDNIKRTFGGITMNGCMAMNDAYNEAGESMTDTWTIFGDPSLMVRTDIPQEITASYPPVALIGESQYVVTCDLEGASVTLNKDGEMLGTAIVENGEATLIFDEPLTSPGTAELVIVGYNHIPLIKNIDVIAGDGPFVIYSNHYVNDTVTGNGNGMLDYNEEAYFSVCLKNVGSELASNVVAKLMTSDMYITVEDSVMDFGDIDTSSVATVNNAFKVFVSPETPNGYVVSFELEMVFGNDTTYSYFTETVNAPELKYLSFVIDDSYGNNNGKLDPGESAMFTVYFTNSGNSDAYSVSTMLTTIDNNYINITQSNVDYGDLNVSDTAFVVFEVSADGDTPLGFIAHFVFKMTTDLNNTGEGMFNTIVGQKPVIVLNLAESSITADSMQKCFVELSVSADFVNVVPESIIEYKCAFVLLGVYSNNYVLTEEEGEVLAEFLDNGGRVYMEGGDTWKYNEPTSVHPYFHIDGISDGSSSLETIIGDTSNFMKGFMFNYEGANNWIDEIEPVDNAKVLLKNLSSNYNGPVAISYENDTYKTIGSSLEFGGLVPGGLFNSGGTKTGYMALILNYFNVAFMWTGVEETTVKNDLDINVYPNPFRNILHIDIKGKIADDARLYLYDIQGKVIKTVEINKNRFVLNVGNDIFKPGVYFYRLHNGTISSTGKVVYVR